MNQSKKKITIIGAGFSGLTSAYYLHKAGYQVQVIEKQPRAGGLIQTHALPHGLVETAANGILNSHLLEKLSEDILFEWLKPCPGGRKRFIYRKGLRRWPISLIETLSSGTRFLFANKKPKSFETVEQWGERIFGQTFFKYLIAPALQGIYAGDPQKLSATLIFSRFFDKNKKKYPKPKYRGTVSPQKGMGQFIEHLRSYLEKNGVSFKWQQTIEDLSSELTIIATSAPEAAKILKNKNTEAANLLADIEMLSIMSMTAFFEKNKDDPEGFGCLFPRDEGVEALGVLFNSSLFENRSHIRSETWIYKGTQKSDLEMIDLLIEDRSKGLNQKSELVYCQMQMWSKAFPHYTVKLEETLNRLSQINLVHDKIFLMGNYLGSLGLSQILQKASELPEKIAEVQL